MAVAFQRAGRRAAGIGHQDGDRPDEPAGFLDDAAAFGRLADVAGDREDFAVDFGCCPFRLVGEAMNVVRTLSPLPGLSRQPSAQLDFRIPGTSPGMTVEECVTAVDHDAHARLRKRFRAGQAEPLRTAEKEGGQAGNTKVHEVSSF